MVLNMFYWHTVWCLYLPLLLRPVDASPSPPKPWKSLGCYIDPSSRLLWTRYDLFDASDMTWEKCAGLCEQGSYIYYGLENGYTCYCGSNLHDPVQKASRSSQCNETCTGNSVQKCGGIDRLQLFSRTVAYPISLTTTSASFTSSTKATTITSKITTQKSSATKSSFSTQSTIASKISTSVKSSTNLNPRTNTTKTTTSKFSTTAPSSSISNLSSNSKTTLSNPITSSKTSSFVTSTTGTSNSATKTSTSVLSTVSVTPLGACKPYLVNGTEAFSSAASPNTFTPDSFIAYGVNSTTLPSLLMVAVNATNQDNTTTILIYDYSSYKATGDTRVISANGTNIILHRNGSITAFADAQCFQPVTVDPSSNSTKRGIDSDATSYATAHDKTSRIIVKRGEYTTCPTLSVELSITDKCGKPQSGESPYMYCNINKHQTLLTDGLVQVGPPGTTLYESSAPGLYKGQCPYPLIRDQSVDPFCNGAADGLVDFCAGMKYFSTALNSASMGGGAGAVCGPLALEVEAATAWTVVGLSSGVIVAGVCYAAIFGIPLICKEIVKKTDYCTPPPTALTLDVTVGEYRSRTSPWLESSVRWQVGGPAPATLKLADFDDRVPLGTCPKPPQCSQDSGYQLLSPWSQVYSGNLFPELRSIPRDICIELSSAGFSNGDANLDNEVATFMVSPYASAYFYCYQTEYTHVDVTDQTLEDGGCISFDCKSPAAFASIFTDDNDAAYNAAQAAIGSNGRENSEVVAYL